jgi:hypothetical protein
MLYWYVGFSFKDGKRKMTKNQVESVVSAIVANEPNRSIADLSDLEIAGYLIDQNIDDSVENIKTIRNQ